MRGVAHGGGNLGNSLFDIYSKQRRSEIMSRIRSTDTNPEDAMYTLVRSLLDRKFRFFRNSPKLEGRPTSASQACPARYSSTAVSFTGARSTEGGWGRVQRGPSWSRLAWTMTPKRRHRRNCNESGHAQGLKFSCYQRFRFLQAEHSCRSQAEPIDETKIAGGSLHSTPATHHPSTRHPCSIGQYW